MVLRIVVTSFSLMVAVQVIDCDKNGTNTTGCNHTNRYVIAFFFCNLLKKKVYLFSLSIFCVFIFLSLSMELDAYKIWHENSIYFSGAYSRVR